MEKRRLGSLDVSVVGLGCNNFGKRLDYERTKSVLDAAIGAGINFLDTADVYGETRSEEFLGRALAARRERVVLATKFGNKIDEHRTGAHPRYVRQACEDSLRRLRTDYIDLYQLHRPDPTVPIADTLSALDRLVKEGKVREIGCSNFDVEQLRAARAAAAPGAAQFASVQNEYSLLHRQPESGVLEECVREGLAFIPFFPLASGLLTGKYRRGERAPEGARLASGLGERFLTDRSIETVEALIQFVTSRGHTLLELAMSWLAQRPAVVSVIAGATRPEQIASNTRAVNWHLSDDDLDQIDRIVAPEAVLVG